MPANVEGDAIEANRAEGAEGAEGANRACNNLVSVSDCATIRPKTRH
jgi:hypothetical protein